MSILNAYLVFISLRIFRNFGSKKHSINVNTGVALGKKEQGLMSRGSVRTCMNLMKYVKSLYCSGSMISLIMVIRIFNLIRSLKKCKMITDLQIQLSFHGFPTQVVLHGSVGVLAIASILITLYYISAYSFARFYPFSSLVCLL